MEDASSTGLKSTSYELFIGALSILSIFNLVVIYAARDSGMADMADAMDVFLSAVFLFDFLFRFVTAESRSGYVFRDFGWADLLASLPFPQLKILRTFRVVRAVRVMRHFGARRMLSELLGNRAGSALLTVLLLIILLLEFGGMLILRAESRSAEANITTAGDAIWWAYVTMTTVGYGDQYPVTPTGRLVGMVVMAAGVGLFGVLTGFLANAFLRPDESEAEDAEDVSAVGDAPDGPASEIAEIRRLLEEQDALRAAALSRLGALERALAEPRERAEGNGEAGAGA